MRIHLAGGAPSTGSSLIRSIINAHPEFMAGPETYLFAHPRLYTDWQKNKYLLLAKGLWGLKNETPFQLNGAQLDKPWYGWRKEELIDLIQSSNTFPFFCQSYFQKSLMPGVTAVVEKSPVNAYCFQQFLDVFPDSSVIHCIRNPYDAIASMVARGLSPYQAVSFYLFNTTFGLRARNHPRYLEIRYEELVEDPASIMQTVMQKLGSTFQASLLLPRNEEELEPTQMQGWNYDENDIVGKGSVRRFELLELNKQQEIIHACHHVRISKAWVEKFSLPADKINMVCTHLNYPVYENPFKSSFSLLIYERYTEQISRFIKGYPNCFSRFPITIR